VVDPPTTQLVDEIVPTERNFMRIHAATALAVVAVASASLVGDAQASPAVSSHSEYYYGGGRYLQANVWLGTGQSFGYATSTKYLGAGRGPSTASSIRNTATITVTGLGVSLGNASGGTSSDKDFSTTWTNYNTWISDRAGTNRVSNNFYLYITGTSVGSASIPYFGSPRTVAASVQKWA
jgi:hypothetical protein